MVAKMQQRNKEPTNGAIFRVAQHIITLVTCLAVTLTLKYNCIAMF